MSELDISGSAWVLVAMGVLLGVAISSIWLRRQLRALQHENISLHRDITRSQASKEHLRERLDDAQDHVHALEARLQQHAEHLQDSEKRYVELQAVHTEKLAHFQQMQASLDESRAQLKLEFQNLANRILDEKGKALAVSSQSSLDAMLRPFREQIDAFQKRVNQIHDEALRGNVSLATEIKRVADMGMQIGHEASTLATALRGEKKTAGNWGEVQLERTLQQVGLMRGEHYEAQPSYKDRQQQRRQPDFVVYLPDNKHIVIDSKVSLVDYDRAVSADTPEQAHDALQAHVRAVRHHIDDLAAKDYSNLTGLHSPSFVLMYMPIEPAFIEALKHDATLYDYGWRKNVILVSPTTLTPVLKTVANIWLIVRSNEQAHQLSEHAGEIYNQVAVMAERLKRLGGTLSTVGRHYNDTVKALSGQQGVIGKVSRFAELSSKANKTLPTLDELNVDFDHELLVVSSDDLPDPEERP